MNTVLIGLRGSGKSSIGRLLAEITARPFIDLDAATARLLDVSGVGEAWARVGEKAFRRAETRALTAALAADEHIIALGGGTPTAPGAADLLRDARDAGRAAIVYLAAEPETLRARLADADMTHRPSLTGADPLAEIDAVFARRDPLYRELASDVIDTDTLGMDAVAERLRHISNRPR